MSNFIWSAEEFSEFTAEVERRLRGTLYFEEVLEEMFPQPEKQEAIIAWLEDNEAYDDDLTIVLEFSRLLKMTPNQPFDFARRRKNDGLIVTHNDGSETTDLTEEELEELDPSFYKHPIWYKSTYEAGPRVFDGWKEVTFEDDGDTSLPFEERIQSDE